MATPILEKEFSSESKNKIPRAFVTRRVHSLLGLWLAIYLFEHLLVNSQAALYFYDDGLGFISLVNRIHALPYLKAIEITLLAFPFIFHAIWGIRYLRSAKLNSFHTNGTKPALPQYRKNRAYSWQRITSWILLVAIIAHVVHMRFLEYPIYVNQGTHESYLLVQKKSELLYKMRDTLALTLYDRNALAAKEKEIQLFAESNGSKEALKEKKEWLQAAKEKA